MDEAVESTEARPERAGSGAAWATRTDVLTIALVVFVLVLVAIRIWVSRKIVTPWIMSDELLYSELARSFAGGHGFLVREGSYPIYNVGYPLLVSPAWLARSMATTYELAKAINVVLMTTALIPVYFWSRRLMRPVYAVVATALVALIPAFVYTGMIMTENASFPAVVLAFFVIALMLERPTLWYQVLALASIGLACLMRTQSLVLAAVLPLAVLVKLALDARAAEPGRRSREFVRGWRPYLPLVAVYLVGGLGVVLVQSARGVSPNRILGAYAGVTTAHYSLNDVASWTVEHAAELGLAVAIFPVSALIVLFALAAGRGNDNAAERAFLAVAASAVVLVVIQVAVFASRFSVRIEERYMFYVVPLLFIALALWLDRGLPRPLVATAIGTITPVALLLALPLGERLNISILPATFGFIPLLRLSSHVSVSTVRLLMIAGAVVAAASFAFLPRRVARVVLPSALALYLVLSTAQVFRTIRDYDLSLRGTVLPAQLDWVDESLPKGASTGVVFGSTADPLGEAQRLWEAEFWNPDVKRVYELQPEPASFAKTPIAVDPLGAKLVPQDHKPYPYRYVLAANGVSLAGKVVADHPPWTLYAVRDPLRLMRVTEGVYPDGWMGSFASRTERTGSAGRLPITISRKSWGGSDVPGHVTIDVGRPILGADGKPKLQSPLRRTWVIHRLQARTFRIPVPKPPYRVEIHIDPTFSPADFGQPDTRQLGAQIEFGRAPGTR
jgi:Dolichyl-phosphate-mannose-protein mannosyltransferase